MIRGVGRTVRMIEAAKEGLWPVAGGSLDQAAWFVDANRFWHAQIAMIEGKRK
jgi:hypothetical protein